MQTPVALYARTSGKDKEAQRAVEAQLNEMRDHAGQNNMDPVNHFVDEHGSREEFDWMMAQVTSDNPPFEPSSSTP